ncbi:FAD-dependent monooxygenase [Rhodococcus sp. T2V]|uniref:FAD-dependent monooxygenase n=1 Tax=Rhodococcus sp. T2V TaxID=3034164 RepID=UPI0023E10C4D|nr:FAD-dependent monooxygenase [Rhodococcus sp. T2V]MDF3311082.1 FAD-dependent monooxygenase [Rhodococcus sp. T2V]
MTSENKQILIVGGGICGMATALACARNGVRSQVLEKSPSFGELGAGLQLGPNGIRALDTLGVAEEIRRTGRRPERYIARRADDNSEIISFDFGTKFEEQFGAPYLVVHRGDLLDLLIKACVDTGLVTLTSSSDVQEVVQHDDSVTAICADGSTYEGTALIGADGLRSSIRKAVGKTDAPRSTGYVAFRGASPRVDDSVGEVAIWVYDGLHYIEYPIRDGDLLNRVAVFRVAEGTDHRDTEEMARQLRSIFHGMDENVRDAVEQLDLTRCWPMYDRDPSSGWTSGRVLLAGDAAHPMLQYLAQGGIQALEDAVALGALVAKSPDDPAAVFAEFEEQRFLRTSVVQLSARFSGEVCYLPGTGAKFRDLALRGRSSDNYDVLEWLYSPNTTKEMHKTVLEFLRNIEVGDVDSLSGL